MLPAVCCHVCNKSNLIPSRAFKTSQMLFVLLNITHSVEDTAPSIFRPSAAQNHLVNLFVVNIRERPSRFHQPSCPAWGPGKRMENSSTPLPHRKGMKQMHIRETRKMLNIWLLLPGSRSKTSGMRHWQRGEAERSQDESEKGGERSSCSLAFQAYRNKQKSSLTFQTEDEHC